MRTLSAPSLLLALAVAGCASEAPTSALPDAPHLARASTPARRPFTGRCETSFAPPPLPLPPVLRQVDTGT